MGLRWETGDEFLVFACRLRPSLLRVASYHLRRKTNRTAATLVLPLHWGRPRPLFANSGVGGCTCSGELQQSVVANLRMKAKCRIAEREKEAAALVERVINRYRSTIYDYYGSESTIYDARIIRKKIAPHTRISHPSFSWNSAHNI